MKTTSQVAAPNVPIPPIKPQSPYIILLMIA